MENAIKMNCVILSNNVKLTKPFEYFLATLKELPYSKIVLTDNLGIVGEGEVCHSIDINGELQENSNCFEPYVNNVLNKKTSINSVEDISNILEEVRLFIAHNTGLLCGVEQALFSILSQKTNKNLTELLGCSRNKKEISIQITIPYLSDIGEYKNHIQKIVSNHQPAYVKFKIGRNLFLEISAIKFLQEICSTISISVDANQTFSDVFAAISFANQLYELKVAWAEQLLHKDNIKDLRTLRTQIRLPLMVDEGLHTPLEAEFYAKEKLYDYFNIKLAKTGGILKTLEIIAIAKEYNIPVMLGSMLHGKIGLEYNLGFALSQNFITQDFYSYFSVSETKELGYISNDLKVSFRSLYKY